MLRTMRGEAENDFQGDWSESDVEFSPFARQLTITKAKRLIRRHTKKFRSRGQKGLLNCYCLFSSSILMIVTFLVFAASLGIISRDVYNSANPFTLRVINYTSQGYLVIPYILDLYLVNLT